MTKYYITGTRRGLGEELKKRYGSVDTLEECDVFINCKHDGYSQVHMLYQATDLGKRVINIGSNSPDQDKGRVHPYAVEKSALDKANSQLFYVGFDTTILRFGWMDTPRVKGIIADKMSVEYCADVLEWVLNQKHRVKEITITP
jgi:hypothetical protein